MEPHNSEVPEEEVAGADKAPATPAAEGGPPEETKESSDPAGEAPSAGDDRARQIADGSEEGASTGQDAEALADPLSEAMASIASLEERLARRNADVYNLEQEYGNFVRRSKAEGAARREEGVVSVVTALLPVLDDVELARQHGDLTGPTGAILDKLEQTLRASFGLERYGAVGDDFDPQIHEALMHSSSAEVQTEQVGTLVQPGYRIGEKVVRAARVGVVSPE